MRRLKGKNILVTGGAGFIGSHLVDEIIKKEPAKLVVLDNFFLGKEENLRAAKKFPHFKLYRDDASRYELVEELIEKEKIEVVFNLATKALLYSFVDQDDAYMVNVDVASVILRLLHQKKYQTLIHFSSSEAYGTARQVPIAEDHPLFPETLYAAGKASADLMVHAYCRTFDLDIVTVRPFNNYGPRQNEGTYAALIPITIKRILKGQKPLLEGTGKQTRDFIFVKDTVEAALALYENESASGQIVNVASGEETSVKEIIDSVCKALDYKGDWEKAPRRVADVDRHLASTKLAQKLIDFKPQVSLEEGLKQTVAWYVKSLKGVEND
jgi:UDP-glucose 4-epimerase